MSDVPLFTPPVPVTAHSASNAYKQVVSLAGYNNVRDTVDVRILSNVVNRVFGPYLHSQSEVGGWPALNTYNVPVDTDRDGMPDYWETANGLNPNTANNNHTNSDGYTDLEQYLNWLAGLHAVGTANHFLDINLRSFTAGMASNAVYSVANPTNGTVALLPDGRTARFAPNTDFFGRASFSFTSVDTLAGGGMTNTVGLLIRPQPRFTSIAAPPGKLVVSGSGGTPFGTYYLLTTTNLASAGNWTRSSTNQFDASGNLSFTNSLDFNSSRKFFRIEVP
jgi:hypothetical protein